MTRTVTIKTVGCRLNQAESETLARAFEAAGFKVVGNAVSADVVVIHSCAVTSVAEQKSARYARAAAARTPRPFVVVIGCASEVNRDAILQESGADLVVGQAGKLDLPDLLPQSIQAGTREADALPRRHLPRRTRALVKMQDGCDFSCAYCVVPRARGRPRSVPFGEVKASVEEAAESGFREIILTGANLGTYRDGPKRLVDAIRAIEAVEGIERIRLSSIEPGAGERDIIDIMASSGKLCRSLNLPLQSGDDRILAAMGRRYTTADYAGLIEYAVSKVERVDIGTDIVVGLPGEDDTSFETTLEFIRRMPFSRLHVFPYSIRPGTRAATMPDQVPRHIAKQRAARLTALGADKQAAFAEGFIGRQVEVLVERVYESGKSGTGWTSEYVQARVEATGIQRNDIVAFRAAAFEHGELRGKATEALPCPRKPACITR